MTELLLTLLAGTTKIVDEYRSGSRRGFPILNLQGQSPMNEMLDAFRYRLFALPVASVGADEGSTPPHTRSILKTESQLARSLAALAEWPA